MSNSENDIQLKRKLSLLPTQSGIYKFYDQSGNIIYIGKAINLKNRIRSYFNSPRARDTKTRLLVSNIFDLSYTIVNGEFDALLLENSLIKKHQPKFNILLKDDKTFPWIVINKEPFPRIFYTRNLKKDGSKYFGPYPSYALLKDILNFIEDTYQIRNCNYCLSEANIKANKFKKCLEYQIGNCKAPCVGLQTDDDYMSQIDEIEKLLNGRVSKVIDKLNQELKKANEKLYFELSYALHQRVTKLKNYQAKSTIISAKNTDIDVFGVMLQDQYAFISSFKVINGCIISAKSYELKSKIKETEEDILSRVIFDQHQKFGNLSKKIIVPFIPAFKLPHKDYVLPKSGDLRKILDLCIKNCENLKKERTQLNRLMIDNIEETEQKRLMKFMRDLNLDKDPKYIECIDNSNFQGKDAVSAIVVFKDLKPSKKDYRVFNVKTLEGKSNDVATIKEILKRRYTRLLNENQELPSLLIIDGGKGQLEAAKSIIKELSLENKIKIIAIAKKLEEIYFSNDPIPILLSKNSETIKILQHIRNEAHRFGIKHHRRKVNQRTLKNEFETIKGIGGKKAEKLIVMYRTLDNLLKQPKEEIIKLVGKKTCEEIIKHAGANIKN